jgi:methionyl-tRNA synthetase
MRALWVAGNEYLQETAPWSAIKSDPARAAVVVRTAINLVAVIAAASAPIIPFTAEKIAAALRETWPAPWPDAGALDAIPAGRKVATPDVLFRKIEPADLAAWSHRFGAPGGE